MISFILAVAEFAAQAAGYAEVAAEVSEIAAAVEQFADVIDELADAQERSDQEYTKTLEAQEEQDTPEVEEEEQEETKPEGDDFADDEEEDDTREEADHEDDGDKEDDGDEEDAGEIPVLEPESEVEEAEEPAEPEPLPEIVEEEPEPIAADDIVLDEQYEESDTSDAQEQIDAAGEMEAPEELKTTGVEIEFPNLLEDEFRNDLYGKAAFDETFGDGITGIEYESEFMVDDIFDELGFDTDALLW